MISIVIDQTSVKNDLTLCVCQISKLKVQLFELITYIQQRRAEKSEYKDIR